MLIQCPKCKWSSRSIASLNPRMIVKDIISEGLVIRGERNKAVIEEKVNKILDMVGLIPDHATRYPHEFSGGQRQQVGLPVL